MNKTKIIATLGPRSSTEESISALINAGMDIARINLSHGERENHKKIIERVKKVRENLQKNTAILLDTRGPEIRVNELDEPVQLVEGRKIYVCASEDKSTIEQIGVNYKDIASEVQAGDRILLDDGKMELVVIAIEKERIETEIKVGGLLTSRKRVSMPGVIINLPAVSDQDRDDITFGVELGVDFIAASFIRRPEDVFAVREIIEKASGDQHLIAKIENKQGVDNLEAILEASDGLMVARGDLGVEMAPEEVPVIQKKIIKSANMKGKPVITATQMLESMISSPTPTRAEATDVTNAVYDGTDAVMLSAETAVGAYPVEAVRFLVRCTKISEKSLDYQAILRAGLRQRRAEASDAIAYASCAIAADVKTAAILTITTSGSTARMVAMYRPQSPIVGLSPVAASLRKLQLVRGVIPLACAQGDNMGQQVEIGVRATLTEGILKKGDMVAITAGLPLHTTGTTNMLRVHTITGKEGLL